MPPSLYFTVFGEEYSLSYAIPGAHDYKTTKISVNRGAAFYQGALICPIYLLFVVRRFDRCDL